LFFFFFFFSPPSCHLRQPRSLLVWDSSPPLSRRPDQRIQTTHQPVVNWLVLSVFALIGLIVYGIGDIHRNRALFATGTFRASFFPPLLFLFILWIRTVLVFCSDRFEFEFQIPAVPASNSCSSFAEPPETPQRPIPRFIPDSSSFRSSSSSIFSFQNRACLSHPLLQTNFNEFSLAIVDS
jgi:hypothetical protein